MVDESSIQLLLRNHARTFALTLRLLPNALREPLSLAYLLARASDTIADAGRIDRARRTAMLEEIIHMVNDGDPLVWKLEIRPEEFSSSEYELLAAMPRLLASLDQLADREEIIRLWRTILKGQFFDMQRFTPEAAPLTRAELEYYCWQVAGSVGETWTQLIAKYDNSILCIALTNDKQMLQWGASYGKGLQLLNILRDRSEDRKMGRFYIQENEVPVLMEQAAAWLDKGRRYCENLHPGRLRYATELPLQLALRTLDQMRKSPSNRRVKISRYEVARGMIQTLPSLVLPRRANPAS